MDVFGSADNFVNYIVIELNKKNTREKIDTMIIDPVITHIMMKIHPYLITMSLIFTLLFFLLFAILILMMKDKIYT